MGRMYTAPFAGVAVTAAQDLWEVLAGTGKPVVVHGYHLFQTTDTGDAAEEILRLETVRGVGSVTSGSGGSTVTPQQVNNTDAASGMTVEINNTTRMAAGSGSLETLEQHGFNVRIPTPFWWTPEMRPIILPGERWTLAIQAAPTDSLTMSGTLYLEEIG